MHPIWDLHLHLCFGLWKHIDACQANQLKSEGLHTSCNGHYPPVLKRTLGLIYRAPQCLTEFFHWHFFFTINFINLVKNVLGEVSNRSYAIIRLSDVIGLSLYLVLPHLHTATLLLWPSAKFCIIHEELEQKQNTLAPHYCHSIYDQVYLSI